MPQWTRHLDHSHGCRIATTEAGRLETLGVLFKEDEHGATEVRRI